MTPTFWIFAAIRFQVYHNSSDDAQVAANFLFDGMAELVRFGDPHFGIN